LCILLVLTSEIKQKKSHTIGKFSNLIATQGICYFL